MIRPSNLLSRACLVQSLVLSLSLGASCTRPIDSEGEEADPSVPADSNNSQLPEATEENPDPEESAPEQDPDDPTEDPDPEPSDSPQEEPATCVGESLHCAAPTPAGWFGPLQLQKMKTGQEAVDCEAALPDAFFEQEEDEAVADDAVQPSFKKNLFVDEATGSKARCSGCKASFQEGTCLQPTWSLRRLDSNAASGCGDEEIQLGQAIEEFQCQVANLSSGQGQGWTILPPKVDSPGRCHPDQGNVQVDIPVLEYGDYFRSCKIETSKESCSGQDETCLSAQTDAPWLNQVCIAKLGEHACEAAAYPVKRLAYAKVSDNRGCTECTATKQAGEERCDALIYVQSKDEKECEDRNLVEPANVCVQHYRFRSLEPVTMIRGPIKYTFSGGCTPNRMKPKGEVDLRDPMTFCCQNP